MMRASGPGALLGQCAALMYRFAPGLYACGELMTVAEGILADMRRAGKEKGR
ncbi:MAG: hypothetical protein ACI4L8_01640 [Candidatus Fimadaptatus sp.]